MRRMNNGQLPLFHLPCVSILLPIKLLKTGLLSKEKPKQKFLRKTGCMMESQVNLVCSEKVNIFLSRLYLQIKRPNLLKGIAIQMDALQK